MSVSNDTIPVVSGTAQQGSTLSTTNGTWTFSLDYLTYAYQWLRCDAMGASCSPIGGATNSSYLLTSADVGSTVRSEVTATEHATAAFDRFAARNGSDSNPGTEAQPYLTADKLFNSLLPGEIGAMKAGVYNELSSTGQYAVYIGSAGSGSSGSPIQVQNFPGDTVEIRGPAKIYRNWLQVSGISINARPANDERDDAWWILGDDVTFTNCDFTNNNYTNLSLNQSRGSAIFLSSADRFTLQHSSVHDIRWDGVGNQPHGIYCHDSSDLLVTNNKFYNITQYNSFGVQLYPGPNVSPVISYNTMDLNNSSIVMYGSNTSPNINHNIFSNGGGSGNAQIHTDGTPTSPSITNNHSYNNASGDTDGPISSSGWTTGNPLYTTPAPAVYYPLGGGSPAAGKGTNW